MEYQIIPIEEKHIKQFNEAVGIVAREKKYLAFLDSPSLNSTINFVTENIAKDYPHFVVIANNKVVGWCDIIPKYVGASSHIGVLGVGLLPEFRGKKIGTELIKKALEKAKKKNLTRIELDVRVENENAIALYKKLGFETEGTLRKTIKINDTYSDTLIMALYF